MTASAEQPASFSSESYELLEQCITRAADKPSMGYLLYARVLDTVEAVGTAGQALGTVVGLDTNELAVEASRPELEYMLDQFSRIAEVTPAQFEATVRDMLPGFKKEYPGLFVNVDTISDTMQSNVASGLFRRITGR